MFSLSIAFGNVNWRLLFNTEEKANAAYAALHAPPNKTVDFNAADRIELIDDFDQRISLSRSAGYGIMLENFDKAKLAAIEFGMHNARTQAGFQARAQADHSLRQRGPAVLAPMGNGQFNA